MPASFGVMIRVRLAEFLRPLKGDGGSIAVELSAACGYIFEGDPSEDEAWARYGAFVANRTKGSRAISTGLYDDMKTRILTGEAPVVAKQEVAPPPTAEQVTEPEGDDVTDDDTGDEVTGDDTGNAVQTPEPVKPKREKLTLPQKNK